MRQEDHNPLSKAEEVRLAFESTKYDQWMKTDPLTAKQAIAEDIINIKQQNHEREQAAKESTAAAERAAAEARDQELEELRQYKRKMTGDTSASYTGENTPAQ